MRGVDLYCTIDKRKQAYWLSGMDWCKILLFDGKILPFFLPDTMFTYLKTFSLPEILMDSLSLQP